MLERLIEIFKESINSSGLHRKPEPSETFIRNLVTLLMTSIQGDPETQPEKKFFEFIALCHSADFGHQSDIVTRVKHALAFNEGFINILSAMEIDRCPAVIIAYAGQVLQPYGSNYRLRIGFEAKLSRLYQSQLHSDLQRLHLYSTILSFEITADNKTDIGGLTLIAINDDATKIYNRWKNQSSEAGKSSEIIVMTRYVVALTLVKPNVVDLTVREKFDARAFKLFTENITADHAPSKVSLAQLYEAGRVKDVSKTEANDKALELYKQAALGKSILGACPTLGLLQHKDLNVVLSSLDRYNMDCISLLRRAATRGSISGVVNLAMMQTAEPVQARSGGNYDSSHHEARELLQLAASRGNRIAEEVLLILDAKIAKAGFDPKTQTGSTYSSLRFMSSSATTKTSNTRPPFVSPTMTSSTSTADSKKRYSTFTIDPDSDDDTDDKNNEQKAIESTNKFAKTTN